MLFLSLKPSSCLPLNLCSNIFFPYLNFSYLQICFTLCVIINYIKSFVQWGRTWVNEARIWIRMDGWLLVPEWYRPNRPQYDSPTKMHSLYPLKESFHYEIQSLRSLLGKLLIIFLIQWREECFTEFTFVFLGCELLRKIYISEVRQK